MPSIRLPLVAPLNENLDPIEATAFADKIWDGYLNEAESLVRRPGTKEFVTLPKAGRVDGLFFWEETGVLVAVVEGDVYLVEEDGTSTLVGNSMNFGTKVSFAPYNTNGEQRLAMCNGGRVNILKSGVLAPVDDPQAPVSCDHIIHFDGYLIANNSDDGNFRYSEVLNVESWSALDFANAESKPDPIVGVWSIGGYIYLLGSRSVEVYYNDGSSPFIRNRSLETPGGVLAPYSVAQIGQALVYLDDRKRVVVHSGSQVRVVSGAISSDLVSLRDPQEVEGSAITVAGKIFYLLNTSEGTLVYDLDNNIWYRWGRWNTLTSTYDNYLPAITTLSRRWGRTFISSGENDGKVLEIDSSTYQDVGQPIRTSIRSGFIDHGTPNIKLSNKLSMRIKRGTASAGSSDTLIDLKGRNELGGWTMQKSFEIGESGDEDFYIWFMALGQYRARQWEISCASNTPFIMSGVIEDITLGVT